MTLAACAGAPGHYTVLMLVDEQSSPEQVEIFRRMTPEERWQAARQLDWTMRRHKAAFLQSQHPDWSEQQVAAAVRDLEGFWTTNPPLKRWAIIGRPAGTSVKGSPTLEAGARGLQWERKRPVGGMDLETPYGRVAQVNKPENRLFGVWKGPGFTGVSTLLRPGTDALRGLGWHALTSAAMETRGDGLGWFRNRRVVGWSTILDFGRPGRDLEGFWTTNPPLKRRAIIGRPAGTSVKGSSTMEAGAHGLQCERKRPVCGMDLETPYVVSYEIGGDGLGWFRNRRVVGCVKPAFRPVTRCTGGRGLVWRGPGGR
jgi:hypothetical protein